MNVSSHTNRATAMRQIVAANIVKDCTDREKVIDDTLLFLENFEKLSSKQVKELTLMRQANDNKDLELVSIFTVKTPEALADNMEAHYYVSNYIVLKKGEKLKTPDVSLSPGNL